MHVWLEKPQLQLLVKGTEIVPKEWRRKRFGLLRRRLLLTAENGDKMLLDASNVLLVKEVTAQELKEAEERKKLADEAAAKGRIQKPAMMIPGMRPAGR